MRNVLLKSTRIDFDFPTGAVPSSSSFVPGMVLAGDFDGDGFQELILVDVHGYICLRKVFLLYVHITCILFDMV